MTVPFCELPAYTCNVLMMLARAQHTGAVVLFLKGELGSGKTTFVQHLAKELGIEEIVQSPTYVLMKTYEVRKNPPGAPRLRTLVHVDAYRLSSSSEFSALKPETFLTDPETLVCIEWPERVVAALPKPALTLAFSSEGVGEEERDIQVE